MVMSNRLFGRLALACLGTILVACAGGGTGEGRGAASPDVIFHNGRIYTADAQQRIVSALAIGADRIVARGSDSEMLSLRGADTRVVDLQGRLMVPGLHDSHIHSVGVIQYESCNLESRAVDLRELSAFVRACLERMAIPEGEWLSVRQWSFGENNLPAGGYANLREALDAAAPRHPVILLGNDGHHNATNSQGLARATTAEGERVGLSASTLQRHFAELTPFVGVDRRGEPDGAINEGAYRALGAPGIMDADVSLIAERAAQLPARLNSLGITSMQDAAVAPAIQPVYDALLASGPVPLRIRLAQYLLPEDYMDAEGELDMDRLLADAAATRDKYAAHPNIDANSLKYFVDGVLEGNPLADPPTLPNAAVLGHLHQPRFSLDVQSQQIELTGYVDPAGEACQGWRQGGGDADRFMSVQGFHPDQCQRSRGVMFAPEAVTHEFTRAADAAGFAIHFHAIGDRSVRTAVDAIARVTPEGTSVNRHSMTHLQLVADEEIERLGELKIPLAFTFAWARSAFMYDATVIPFIEQLSSLEDMYNPEGYYYQHVYPARSIQQAGGILAAGSDAPVETDDPRPFENIEAAVTRDRGEGVLNPEERLDIRSAIDAYTINGARLLGQQALTGSLEPGKKADLVVLDRDIIALAESGRASEIHATQALQTWFDGRKVYESPQLLVQE